MKTTTMTSGERILRAFEHREGDRVPITDSPWKSTLERWHREGLPTDLHWAEYFDLDSVGHIRVDNRPRFPVEVVQETKEWVIRKTVWGATQKHFKHRGGVPEYLDFDVVDPDSWRRAKERMTPGDDRIPWRQLERDYPVWKERGAWIQANLWFGFDVTHSHMVGTERLLIAMAMEPEWTAEMFGHLLDLHLALYDRVWEAGYRFDSIRWPDDMGYKLAQFFSLDMYGELVKPVHARAAAWAREKGVKVHLHSCGDIRPFVPDLIEAGIDMLNPLEVKAGVDPVWMKNTYGDTIGLHGGLNAVLYDDMDQMEATMREVVPKMKRGGGYWLSTDHSVPDTVSFQDFRRFTGVAKEIGSFDR